jgi:hypothetical protein
MHCPKCGQEQVAADTKFCSRCGFQLAIVAELLTYGGTLPQLAALNSETPFWTRKKGLMFAGFWFVLFTMLLTSIAGILDLGDLPGVTAVVGFFGAILIMIGSLVFLPPSRRYPPIPALPPRQPDADVGLMGRSNAGAIGPGVDQPANFYSAPMGNWRAPDTGELATPGSVTENTTKLLSKDPDE